MRETLARREKAQVVEREREREQGIALLSYRANVSLHATRSMWNRNPKQPHATWRYAGTYDVALATEGITDALEAGDQMADIHIDVVFCSVLSRAISTACIALSKHHSGLSPLVVAKNGSYEDGMKKVAKLPPHCVMPIICAAELNERCFGDLEGVPSTEHTVKHTEKELSKMRNEFSSRFPGQDGESTEDVYNRVVPYFNANILPLLKAGQNVLLCSHGFAIRALVKYMDQMTDEEVSGSWLSARGTVRAYMCQAKGYPRSVD
jgi:2,3-bisphosphoglycerate-dependent phosphoglycerate mutase